MIAEKSDIKFPIVPAETNYWFIRTDGGKLYGAFLSNNEIAVGYPEITMSDMALLKSKEDEGKLINKIKSHYPKHKRPGLIESQLFRFKNDIKKGDFVVIPNASTKEIAIGRVMDDAIFSGKAYTLRRMGKDFPEKGFFKRRKIKWLKQIKRAKINPKLLQMFNSHQTINNATDYGDYIDSSVFSFYQKASSYNLVINVEAEHKLKARDLYDTIVDLMDMSDEILKNKLKNTQYDSREIESQTNLNSPGFIKFISDHRGTLLIMGVLIVGLNGGTMDMGWGDAHMKLGLDKGTIAYVKEYLEDTENREMKKVLTAKLKNLNVKSPAELIQILEAIQKLEGGKESAVKVKKD